MQKIGSWLSWLASQTEAKRKKILNGLSPDELTALEQEWEFKARPGQAIPDGDWICWMIQTGRGWGKTRTGAESTIAMVKSGKARHVHLVAPSAADVRDVMVEGESGILTVSPDNFRPLYEPSKRRLTWPNGATATTFSADKPDQLRGPQCDWAWCDELASWRYPQAWDMLLFGLRLGESPKVIVTTTPRPRRFLRQLARAKTTVLTTGSTRENIANLAPTFVTAIFDKYEGTSLGRQELEGELLSEIPGAIFTRQAVDENRATVDASKLERIVIAIDPAVTSNKETSDESGIIVAGVMGGHFYVLEDASMIAPPDVVVTKAVELFHTYKADTLTVEKNQGGDLWRTIATQIDERVPVQLVHASRGKHTRAQPVAARYEQGKVHHVKVFEELEDQLCNFVPGIDSGHDDRLDALVWAITDLDSNTLPAIDMDISINHSGQSLTWMR